MKDDDLPEDVPPPADTENFSEAKEMQINRMAGCARYGSCLLTVVLGLTVVFLLYEGGRRMGFYTSGGDKTIVRTKRMMRNLEIGSGHFHTQYQRYPVTGMVETEVRSRGVWIQALDGNEATLNPRQIRFMDIPRDAKGMGGIRDENGETVMVDPWGNAYYVRLDLNGDNRIANPESGHTKNAPAELSSSILIYSSGPDGDPKTWADNVCSWR